jgi:hypothetical protein
LLQEACGGKIDQETVFFMNEALNRQWVQIKNGYYYIFNTAKGIQDER